MSEPRGVGVVVWAEAMPLEISRPAAVNRANCFLICICFPLKLVPRGVNHPSEGSFPAVFYDSNGTKEKTPRLVRG